MVIFHSYVTNYQSVSPVEDGRYEWLHQNHQNDMSWLGWSPKKNWLVVYLPRWKKIVKWDDDIPNWMEKYKIFQASGNQTG